MTFLFTAFRFVHGLAETVCKLTCPWLVYACLGLFVACSVQSCRLDRAVKKVEIQKAKVVAVEGERDAARADLSSAVSANAAAEAVIKAQRGELTKRAEERLRMAAENEAAVKAAKTAARDAEKTLAEFVDRYARAYREPECKKILDTSLDVCR